MHSMNVSHYAGPQRCVETVAIVLFALLAAWSLLRVELAAWLIPFAALAGWLAADLFSGLVHWAFDAWGSVRTPVFGQAFIRPFREHHIDPDAMTRHDFIETNGSSCLGCLPVLAASSVMPLDSDLWILIQAWLLFAALGVLVTNQCHKWAHVDGTSTPALVRWAQRCRLVLRPEHHRLHHAPPFNSHYCTASGWLNRPLNAILRAWR